MMPKPGFGGYADHVVVQAARLVAIPDAVTDDTAIALGLNYVTARQLIHRIVCLEPGQSALVHGAAGGVGTALLDLGRLHGLRLFGTASKGKHEHLRERGCEPIDYRTDDFVERIKALAREGVDAVFDSIGGGHLIRSYQALAPGGTLVSYGVSGDLDKGAWALVNGMGAYAKLKLRRDTKRVRMYNITLSSGASPSHCRSDWGFLLGLAAEGKLNPARGAIVPLDEIQKAHRLMDEAAVMGKIVLNCEESTSR
jgi:NADPH:quinone reductase-like Zn-dependent oxidoreductase